MANPANPGTLDISITDRIFFAVGRPRTGDTGTFEGALTDRIFFEDYVQAASVTGAAHPVILDDLFSPVFGGRVVR
jgi:hypothetical protein